MSGIAHTLLATSLLYAAYKIGQLHLSRSVIKRSTLAVLRQQQSSLSANELLYILADEGTYTEEEITDAIQRWNDSQEK